ncbi:hypothetical protein Lser_V15G26696 [Lactuca serriola]
MAANITTQMILEQSRKRQRLSHAPKLLPTEQVEVRSIEEGLRGSWHRGIVIECRTQIRVVKYHNLLYENTSENLIESIQVSFAVDGNIPTNWRQSDFPNYRGKIRPLPPHIICDKIYLHYRQCVDVFHEDAWWEGVVFDHNDGFDERLVFFPDIGDELRVPLKNLRVTQDWDAATDEWNLRGDWIFLEVIEELKLEWPLVVSVKQIWYEVRMTKCFSKEMKEWTCPVKESWKETVKEVMADNFKLTMADFLHTFSEDMDINKRFLDSVVNLEPSFSKSVEEFHDHDTVLAIKSDHETLNSPSEEPYSKWTKTDIFPQAECFPDAIFEYYKCFKSGKKPPVSTTLKVRQHLSYLGWTIECKIYKIGSKGNATFRYRYTDPNGKQYYSLNVLCTELKNISSNSFNVKNLESLTSSASTKEEPQIQDLHVVESEYCPQAVVDYYSLISAPNFDLQKMRDDKFKKLQISARKHLFAVGWSNFHLEHDSGRKVIVYSSPNGRKFYSLHEACSHYIKESFCFDFNKTFKNENGVLHTESPIKKAESLMTTTTTHVLRSSKRARKDVSSLFQTPRTVLSWLIDNNVVLPRAKVKYICKKNGFTMKEGRITREGIKCSCCQSTFSLLKFQSHGGSSYGRASANIFLEDGRSLLDCQLQIKLDQSSKSNLKGNQHEMVNDNDFICSVCQYGGELVLCDQCPSSFHKSCVGLKEVPDGEWFCPSCCCRICNQNRFSEQNTNSEMINCEQCDKRYHVGCLKRKVGVGSYLEANWFCSSRCKEIFTGLERLLGKSIPVGRDKDKLTWTLRKNKTFECSSTSNDDIDALNMEEIIENYSKLNVAISVMHECFEPVKEARTGRDVVEDVIFCRWSELRRLNFKGFYTVFLEKGDELISTATLRVYGEKVAEIPLVGTRFQYRRRGMCHILMHQLEKILTELGVKRLVLPAVSSVLHTWTRSFGFSVMTESEKFKLLGFTFLDFQGTTTCHKILVKASSSRNNGHVEAQSATNLQPNCCKRIKFRCLSKSNFIEICK